jgi:hypothetical protein
MRASLASPTWRRVVLACSLSLLAFAFAMEAKMAWYGPKSESTQEISATKALPADFPRLADHGSLATQPVVPVSPLVWVAIFAAMATSVSMIAEARQLARIPVSVRSRSHFSPLLFFRPPPSIF